MSTQITPQTLNPVTVPLSGKLLIEASAGTGKTYTIEALYIRLILGELGDSSNNTAFPQGLTPDKILVLTFTRAATEELRHRIQERLENAATYLQLSINANDNGINDQNRNLASDDFLDALFSSIVMTEKEKTTAFRRLLAASQMMDKAAIYTIHGFCQRSLKRFAFTSKQNFNQTLMPDISTLKEQALYDYWRFFIQPLPTPLLSVLLEHGLSSPDGLLQAIAKNKILREEIPQKTPLPLEFTTMAAESAELNHHKEALISLINDEWDELRQWIKTQIHEKQFRKTTLSDKFLKSLAALQSERKVIDSEQLSKLTRQGLAGSLLKSATITESDIPPFKLFYKANEFLSRHEKRKDFPLLPFLTQAHNWIEADINEQIAAQNLITYDGMIEKLALATSDSHSPLAGSLTNQLFLAYPCTLIDEFQDTDSHQYKIFHNLYKERAEGSYLWVMVGDPKQAIYSFRGADIETYIVAKKEIQNYYSLDYNYRSHYAMITATNHLFASSPLQKEEGGVFSAEMINFYPIKMPESAFTKTLQADYGSLAPGISVEVPDLSMTYSKANAITLLADYFAQQANALLTNKIQINGKDLTPPDITFLVRSRSEAESLKEALATYNIDSVFLSEKNSIYHTPEAKDLLTLLKAIAEPTNSRAIRTALAAPSLNYSYTQLAELQSEEKWQEVLQHFKALQTLLQKKGPLPMLYQLFDRFSLTKRQKSERTYTNLFHLAELLQKARETQPTEEALIFFFETAIHSDSLGDEENSERLLRLENERQLVQIMTLHKSKGLQFPLVLIPFAALAGREEWQEEIEEEMRLLYVGITRATHACWLGLLPSRRGRGTEHQLYSSALGRLLFGGNHNTPISIDEIKTRLEELQTLNITVSHPSTQEAISLQPIMVSGGREDSGGLATENIHPSSYQEKPLITLIPFENLVKKAILPPYWGVTSYSALARARKTPTGYFLDTSSSSILENLEWTDKQDEGSDEPLLEKDKLLEITDVSQPTTFHELRRGAVIGNLLHSILEVCQKKGFAKIIENHQLGSLIDDFCRPEKWNEKERILIKEWCQKILTTPLIIEDKAISLVELDKNSCSSNPLTLAETEFWLPLKEQSSKHTLDLFCQELLPIPESNHLFQRPRLDEQALNGMLKGFIDLIFQYQGKFYLMDYKSNHLGNHDSAYGLDNLISAALNHRYDLQGLIYLQALHKLLEARLTNYNPEVHLGGCYFFFLRGINNKETQGLLHLQASKSLLKKMTIFFSSSKQKEEIK